jgi:DNA-binding CsgD family transcriptional regulator
MPVTEAWIDSVYRCATGDMPWDVALRPISQEAGTFCIGAVNHTIMPLKASICINVDGPPNLAEAYEQTFVYANPLIDALSALTPGTIMTGLSRGDDAHHEGTKFFQEYLAPQNVGDTLWISLARRPGEFFMLAAPRLPQAGVFNQTELDNLKTYMPHLTRAFEVWLKLNLYKAENEWVTAAMDQVTNGMITLGPQRTIFYANKAAENFLSSMKGAQRKLLKLQFADAALDLQFQSILDALPNKSQDNILILRRERGQSPLLLRVEPADVPQDGAIIPKAMAVIHIINSDARVLSGLSAFGHSCGLTAAELRLLARLVESGSVIEAAVEAGMAESTARTHVKQIYAKMGVYSLGTLLMKVFKATLT